MSSNEKQKVEAEKHATDDPRTADVPVGKSSPPANGDVGDPKEGSFGDRRTQEWHSRGYLPHRDLPHLLQSVTFRLADSLPQQELRELEDKLALIPKHRRDLERRRSIESWLDSGIGCCALRHPQVAGQVQDSLLYFHRQRYRLLAWCIMPNHVHVLIETLSPLAKIIQGWKSVTARWALAHNTKLNLGIPDPKHFWMREYWDRYIRDDEHLERVIEYIHHNPVKAGFCSSPEHWPWCSAHPRNADVLVGKSSARANEDVGALSEILVGNSPQADEDVGVPR